MKKTLIVLGTSFVLNVAHAQQGKLVSAWNALETYGRDRDVAALESGLPYVNEAIVHPETATSSKAWWYRAQLYLYVSIEKDLKAKYPDASAESLKSFQKIAEINDPKFKNWNDAKERLQDLGRTTFNEGAEEFSAKHYDKAAAAFLRVEDIRTLLESKGSKLPEELSPALEYAGYAATNGNLLPEATSVYEKLNQRSPDSAKYYHTLYQLYKKQDKKAEAASIIDKGLAKAPNDRELLTDKVNLFFSENKTAEAIEYLKQLVAQDPKNEQLSAALGVAYENSGDSENAQKLYQSLLNLNPNSYEGNYGRGTLLFAKAKAINDQMNALGNTKADIEKFDKMKIDRDKIFVEAKPFFEKALSARPDDAKAKSALTQIQLLTQ